MDKAPMFHLIFYYIGITIVFLTHIFMLIMPSMKGMRLHAVINIIGALCIAYYFMYREGFIKF